MIIVQFDAKDNESTTSISYGECQINYNITTLNSIFYFVILSDDFSDYNTLDEYQLFLPSTFAHQNIF